MLAGRRSCERNCRIVRPARNFHEFGGAAMAGAYDDRDGVIWMDGAFVPWREAKVHVLTHALHYASSVFEGERAYGGTIFKSREHSERLLKSCDYIDIPRPYSVDEIEAAKAATLGEIRPRGCLCARPGLARLRRGHGRRLGAQPGPHGGRGLGMGRLLRRCEDEAARSSTSRSGSGPRPRPSPASPRRAGST